MFPTDRLVTVWATLTDENYQWQMWTGSLPTVVVTNTFYMTTNMVMEALFQPLLSNTNGVPDWWLNQYDINTTQEGADEDSDLDGHANWKEFFAGTVPTNPASILMLNDLAPSGGRMAITFASVPDKQYRMASAPDQIGPWTNEHTSQTPDGPFLTDPFTA